MSSHLKPWVQAQVPRGPRADLQAVGRPSAALPDKALTAHPWRSHWDSSFEDFDKVNFPHPKSLSPLVTIQGIGSQVTCSLPDPHLLCPLFFPPTAQLPLAPFWTCSFSLKPPDPCHPHPLVSYCPLAQREACTSPEMLPLRPSHAKVLRPPPRAPTTHTVLLCRSEMVRQSLPPVGRPWSPAQARPLRWGPGSHGVGSGGWAVNSPGPQLSADTAHLGRAGWELQHSVISCPTVTS